jgi:hypothetical protein
MIYKLKGVFMMNKLGKLEDYLPMDKINELMGKPVKKKTSPLKVIFMVVGGLVVVGGIAYCIYRFLNRDEFEDFEDDFDEFDDDYFEDETEL